MEYYLMLFKNGSLKIYKNKQSRGRMEEGARQFVCSSNVTVQDLHVWASNGYKKLNTVREIEN
ncbi:MAG: hypothetical protein BWX99_00875 [Deltaproteobacteria bacterium ADurb.Bin151]|jgi:hypothetical protein|nr:hypothetical protein [Smithella sp.]OQB56085.1 MAG: hypothetical protein BWX99_00875 [Deltaproteobacteria bacterium ADurb.Bin151]HNZ10252.1 hypothetical protein [Smithellaceae bacterium]HOG81517.1 hypothetical protein [Smithellaceae bacterium]HOQ41205.1 hypothetical protein [Smithellaceae bacterium]